MTERTTGSSLFPAAASPQRSVPESNGRNKIALKPGRSLMDWVRLGQASKDLSGTGGKLRDITPQELACHKWRRDCWTALSGKVYNVTPYMDFHPGGEEELMRAAGRDGTRLFNEVHKWVNFESMLQKCLVGRLVAGSGGISAPAYGNLLTASRAQPADKACLPTASPDMVAIPKPRFDFYETDAYVKLSVYTRTADVEAGDVMIGPSQDDSSGMKVLVRFPKLQKTYVLHFVPHKATQDDIKVKVFSSIGKTDITISKKETGELWKTLGRALPSHDSMVDDLIGLSWICRVASVVDVTHDTKLYELQLPPASHLCVPTGGHVHISVDVNGMDINRSYTPVHRLGSFSGTWHSSQLLLLIKIYERGTVTPVIGQLQPGDKVCVSGYAGSFATTAMASFQKCNSFLLLAAGTGFTPMVKVIVAALALKKSVHLMFFNKTEQDIIWPKELADLSTSSGSLFQVTHVLSSPSETWSGEKGHIRDELLLAALLSHQPNEGFVCVCGPSGFTDTTMRILTDMRFPQQHTYAFTA